MIWLINPEGNVTGDTIKELNNQSPRTVAIVGAAIIEDCLARLIGMKFPVDGKTKNKIFSAEGPLGTLASKIMVGYSMGILSKSAFQDLKRITEVRNKFAHQLEINEFEHEEVRSICFDLEMIETHVFPNGTKIEDFPDENMTSFTVPDLGERLESPQGRFFLSVMLFHSLDGHVPHSSNPKPSLPRAFI